jgi:SAM-dependent methyltransferase
MGDLTRGDPSRDQDIIWRHFQNRHPEVFARATARTDYLIKEVSRKMRMTVPRVLNIGAGNGYLEQRAMGLGWEISSLDPDPGPVNRLLEKGITAYQGYMEKMPFANDSFDVVVASEVLEHLNDRQLQDGLGEVMRVLRKGGWFIGTVPHNEDLALNEVVCPHCGEVFHRWGHQRSFDLMTLQKALSPYFNAPMIKRKTFVEFKGRPVSGKIKGLIRLILGHCGSPMAVPNIYFAARNQ